MILKTALTNCCSELTVGFGHTSRELSVGSRKMTMEGVGRGLSQLICGSLCVGGAELRKGGEENCSRGAKPGTYLRSSLAC